MTSSMTSSPWNILCGTIWEGLFTSEGKLQLCLIFQTFQNGRHFQVATNFFYWISISKCDLLCDLVTSSMTSWERETELAQLDTTFWPRDPIIWPLTYIINGFLAMTKIHIWVKFGDDWSNGTTCILLTTFIRTDKQTNKQTDRQIVRRTYLPKLKILASNKPSDEHICQNITSPTRVIIKWYIQ